MQWYCTNLKWYEAHELPVILRQLSCWLCLALAWLQQAFSLWAPPHTTYHRQKPKNNGKLLSLWQSLFSADCRGYAEKIPKSCVRKCEQLPPLWLIHLRLLFHLNSLAFVTGEVGKITWTENVLEAQPGASSHCIFCDSFFGKKNLIM